MLLTSSLDTACHTDYFHYSFGCFSPMWLILCLVKLADRLNAFSQMEHWNGFSPLWLRLWAVKLPDLVNDFSQMEHWNVFFSTMASFMGS